jgi:chitinase
MMITRPILAAYCGHYGIDTITVSDVQRLDILFYAFGIVQNGTVTLEHPEDFAMFQKYRQLNPQLKILLSLSGGGENGFSTAARTPAERERLVVDTLRIVKKYDFDGVDVDWEFPTVNGVAEERDWHTQLLCLFHQELDKLSDERKYLLSIAAPCGEWCFQVLDLERSVKYLDLVNLMTYDMAAGLHMTCHHTAAYAQAKRQLAQASIVENVQIFAAHGIPREKMIVGAAFYSRLWHGVEAIEQGLFVPTKDGSEYGPGYTELIYHYENRNGYTRYWDDTAKAPYLFNGDTFITYDDKESLAIKCRQVHELAVAGIMVWEYAYDKEHVLIRHMRESLDNKIQ